MIEQPPSALTQSERNRLEVVGLPDHGDIEGMAVYRFEDTGEFVAEDDQTEAAIKQAYPNATIRRL